MVFLIRGKNTRFLIFLGVFLCTIQYSQAWPQTRNNEVASNGEFWLTYIYITEQISKKIGQDRCVYVPTYENPSFALTELFRNLQNNQAYLPIYIYKGAEALENKGDNNTFIFRYS